MKILRSVAAGAAILFSTAPAYAFEFSPLVAELAPSGPGASRSFVLRNTKSEPIAIQIEAAKRTTSASGEEVQTPETEDLIITPPQLVLAPGASQSVRVQWIGDPSPQKELAYRLLVNQLPIKYRTEQLPDQRQAQVFLGYRYEAALYVTPAGGKPEARLVKAEPAQGKAGEKVLAVTLESVGATRALLSQPQLKLRSRAGGGWISVSEEALKPLNPTNLIAGTTVRYELPWPSELAYGPVEAEFSTSYLSVK